MQSVALVTGCSSGFGLLTAIELARTGLQVVATLRDLTRAQPLRDAAREAGVTLDVRQLDVTSSDSLARLAGELSAAGLAVEVLVNNAGFGMGGSFEDLTLDELRVQFETNFFGVAAVTKAFLPGMRERARGRIINVSSIAGRLAMPGLSAYCASKYAVEGLSESLRLELAPLGIQVVLVEPGTFRTDIFGPNRRVAAAALDPASPYRAATEGMERAVERILRRATADPRDVADAIVHAATTPSPELRYLVGRDAHLEAMAKRFLPWSWVEQGVRRGLERLSRP